VKPLDHPLRVHILLLMVVRGYLSAAEFERTGAATLNKSAYHFRALRKAGAISLLETRRSRGAKEGVYRLSIRSIAVRSLLLVLLASKPADLDHRHKVKVSVEDYPAEVSIELAFAIEVDNLGVEELEGFIGQVLPRGLGEIRRRTRARALGSAHDQEVRQLRLAVAVEGVD
jgi:hypothetical protein